MEQENFWVYVLELENGKKYVGHTNNLYRRIQEHKDGRSTYTSKYKINKLLYYEKHNSRSQAMKREKFLKSGNGRQWLNQQLIEQSASWLIGSLIIPT